jgi:hypothetical protein
MSMFNEELNFFQDILAFKCAGKLIASDITSVETLERCFLLIIDLLQVTFMNRCMFLAVPVTTWTFCKYLLLVPHVSQNTSKKMQIEVYLLIFRILVLWMWWTSANKVIVGLAIFSNVLWSIFTRHWACNCVNDIIQIQWHSLSNPSIYRMYCSTTSPNTIAIPNWIWFDVIVFD